MAIVHDVTQRRSLGGARREATERVVLRAGAFEVDAWTLNVSRGGLRVVVEEPVTVGNEYEVVGESGARPARVVWVREETDGQIAGLQFLDLEEGESIYPSSGLSGS